MVAGAIQLTGYILGVVAWVGMIGTCASPEWRKNSQGNSIMATIQSYDGLWLRCKSFPDGNTNCVKYKAFYVGLSKTLQVCRSLMITSLCLGFIGVIITSCGLKCVTLASTHQRVKAKVAIVGGFMFGASAVFTGAAVSYYAQGVVQEYYNPSLSIGSHFYLRFEYGYSLFVGWATLVVGIVSSMLIIGGSVAIHIKRPQTLEAQPVSILAKPPALPLHSIYRLPMTNLNNQSQHRQVRISKALSLSSASSTRKSSKKNNFVVNNELRTSQRSRNISSQNSSQSPERFQEYV